MAKSELTEASATNRTGLIAACTIVAENYLAFARVLAASLASAHPDWDFHVLLLKREGHALQDSVSRDKFRVLNLREIGLGTDDEVILPAIYDVTELATAVKPWLLKTLLGRGYQAVLYLDPDILVMDRLDQLAKIAVQEGICLTPHTVEPLPRDGFRPAESEIYLSGIYNLGFIGVATGAMPMLEWWRERLRRDCISAPELGRFVDQRWMDAVPAFFRCGICREKRFNVAYWNLQERAIELRDGKFFVENVPLAFFHFSGFNPLRPWLLAKYLGQNPRVLLSENPALRALCDRYAKLLLDEGFAGATRIPYPFNATPSGFPLSKGVRRRYREEVIEAELAGKTPPASPFSPDGEASFLKWLQSTGFDGAINAKRAACDDFLSREASVAELRRHGEALFEKRLMNSAKITPLERLAAATNSSPVKPGPVSEGYCIAGFLAGELGLGTAARAVVAAARQSGLPFATYTYRNVDSRQQHPFEEVGTSGKLSANIICVTADSLPSFRKRVGPDFFEGSYNIGFWFWEVDKFPSRMRPAFDLVDEVWAATDYVVGALRKVSPKPVLKFPMPVAVPEIEPGTDRASFGLPENRFLFLFTFDYLSVFERKNPSGLIAAFRAAFKDGEGPLLVVKSINGDKRRADRERLRYEVAGRSDIIVIEDYMTAARTASLIAACDCYASLHRAEGFGLGMAEAMLFGKPVIATGYSGNMEFMDGDTARLIPYKLIPVGAGFAPYPSGASWAEPDHDAAVQAMREFASNPDAARNLGQRARIHAAAKFDPKHGAEFLKARLTEIGDIRCDKVAQAAKSGRLKRLPENWRLPEEEGRDRSPFSRLLDKVLIRREAERRRKSDQALAEAIRLLRDEISGIRQETTARLNSFEDARTSDENQT